MIEVIVSQGRVADRAARMIEGAARTARAFEQRYGTRSRYIGRPAPHAKDAWSVSLPQARETLNGLARAIEESVKAGGLTVLLSNTCSASLASLPVVAREHPDAVVLWIDAHGDFNTPATTDSGYLGGMVLAGACGLWDSGHGAGLRSTQVVLVGARDIDAQERQLLDKAHVRIIPPERATPANVLEAVGDRPVWIHVDWDVLEPGHLPADYSVPNGMLPQQIRAIFDALQDRILGIELAEFNASEVPGENEQALQVICEIVSPVLGRRALR